MPRWSDWITWTGGECPIPWAKVGDFQVSLAPETHPIGFPTQDAKDCNWNVFIKYRHILPHV